MSPFERPLIVMDTCINIRKMDIISFFLVTVIKIPEVCRHTFNIGKNELSTSTIISYNYSMWKKFSHQKDRTCHAKFVFKQKSSKNVKVKVAIDGEDSASGCLFDVNVLAYKGSQPLQVRNVPTDHC